jgi:hypothetical protein
MSSKPPSPQEMEHRKKREKEEEKVLKKGKEKKRERKLQESRQIKGEVNILRGENTSTSKIIFL